MSSGLVIIIISVVLLVIWGNVLLLKSNTQFHSPLNKVQHDDDGTEQRSQHQANDKTVESLNDNDN